MRGCVISKVLDDMLNNGYGYRTETYSGSGVRDAEAVIRYELSMGNTDIVRFCQTNYELLKDIVPSDDFFASIEGESIEAQEELREAEFSHICQENADYIAREVVALGLNALGFSDKKDLHALWLTTYENMERYGATDKEDIDEYCLGTARFLVISDLGEDGALFLI
jgi:hypothetical protein